MRKFVMVAAVVVLAACSNKAAEQAAADSVRMRRGHRLPDLRQRERRSASSWTSPSFYDAVAAANIEEVTITGDELGYEITGKFKSTRDRTDRPADKNFTTYVVKDEELIQR